MKINNNEHVQKSMEKVMGQGKILFHNIKNVKVLSITAIVAVIILLASMIEIGHRPIETYHADGIAFSGVDALTVQKANGEIIETKLANIEMFNTSASQEVFQTMLRNPNMYIEVYGEDTDGKQLVEVTIDGLDFDAYVTKHMYANYK